jgi:DNA-binding CsgD family transcriptional regulator
VSASWNLDAVALELSAAALDPRRWKSALQLLSENAGAIGTLLIPVNRRADLISTDGVAEASERYVREGWHLREVRERGVPTMLRRGIMVDQDFMTADQINKSDYYNDLLGRHDLRWFAGLAICAANDLAIVSVQRSITQGPFVPGEQDKLVRLRGPLTAAATVSRELDLAHAKGLAEAFEVLGSAAVIVDYLGRVILANGATEATLTGELRIVKGRLSALEHNVSRRIEELVFQAASSRRGAALKPPVAVPRQGRRPLVVYAVPLVGEALDIFSAARALVIVVDLGARTVPAVAHLRQVFGLTPAESRLVARLGHGEALETAADFLNIAKETARAQLKAAFAKTGTGRQSELVALIGRLLAERSENSSI